MNSLQQQIVIALRQSGMTRADLARKLKCDPSRVSHLLNRKHKFNVDTLERIAKAMGAELKTEFVFNK